MSLPRSLVLASCVLVPSLALATSYNDAFAEIDPGIATGGGTLDILSMEVTNDATSLLFTLTVNGNIATTDWGNFAIGIATGGTGTTTGNAWNRPINLDSPIGGMDFWIGSWVNSGGGSQLWSYNGASWSGPAALSAFSFLSGTTSTISYTVTLDSLGLGVGDTFYFDAYTSGGGGGDSAVDALSNPATSIVAWGQTYTSNTTNGISQFTVVPEPATTAALAGLAVLGVAVLLRRRRA